MGIVLLTCCHFFSGYGLLKLFRLQYKLLVMVPLAMLAGVAIASLMPFILQLVYCPLYPGTVFGALTMACILLNINNFRALRASPWRWKRLLRGIRIRLYEIPYILILAFLVWVSVWRCYYLPPTSRDALSGPEAIAEYAVREHTMINSFFTTELSTTNNQFKSPFLISLQVIYKMAGYPFGQVWLSIIFVSFTLLLYQWLKTAVHPVLGGLLLLLLTITPEMYAYTLMVLYDYSNTVYLFLGLYMLIGYFDNKRSALFWSATFFMGIATYIRSETLVLLVLFMPALWIMRRREGTSFLGLTWWTVLFLLPSVLCYYVTVQLYNNHYLPVHYDVSAQVNQRLMELGPLFRRYKDIITELVVSAFGVRLWGYLMFVFAGLLLAELVVMRRLTRAGRNWLYAIVVVFGGLGLLGHLLPLFSLTDSTKRGLMKVAPMMVFYMCNNQLIVRLSHWIRRWEEASADDVAR